MVATMKAAVYQQFGPPSVLQLIEVEPPTPGAGQVQITVHAVGVNAYDWKVRSGMMGGKLPGRTGIEAAGVVSALGEGVVDAAVGDRVFGNGSGLAAEVGVLTNYAPMPESLSFVEAAGLPVSVETATRTLDLLEVSAGTRLLINGASGAVGAAAVQLAVARGASVIGTASAARHAYVESLGAVPVLYGEDLAERVLALTLKGVDVALDAAGGGALPALIELTGDASRVLTIADYAGAQELGVRFSSGTGDERRPDAIRGVGELIAAGKFVLPEPRTFALAAIAEAHALSETGHAGAKLVLVVE
jgi:NADPH:quinone reductase-like Zn-dependent oxidoreductase